MTELTPTGSGVLAPRRIASENCLHFSPGLLRELERRRTPPTPIVVPDFQDQSACSSLIHDFEQSVPRPRTFQGVVNRALRDCEYVPLPRHRHGPFERFFGAELSARFNAPVGLELPPMIYRYAAGIGMVPHHDLVTRIERERCAASGEPVLGGDFTTVLFLNSMTASDGGALSFPGTDVRIIPRCGTLVIFRVDTIHQVERVIRGPRYTVVARATFK